MNPEDRVTPLSRDVAQAIGAAVFVALLLAAMFKAGLWYVGAPQQPDPEPEPDVPFLVIPAPRVSPAPVGRQVQRGGKFS